MNSRIGTLLGVLALSACTSPSDSGKPMPFDMAQPDALDHAEEVARSFVSRATVKRSVEDLVVRERLLDPLGAAHLRMQQHLGGVPVFGGNAVVHVPQDGSRVWMSDGLKHNVQVDVRPEVLADEALRLAEGELDGPVDRSEVDLQILRHEGADYLTWRVQIWSFSGDAPAMPVVFVDAHRGDIVWSYSNLQTARDRDTHDANNGGILPGTLVREEGDAAISDDAVDDAHDYAGDTYDYYDTFQGRDSYDDGGATLSSTAHYGSNYLNAFWNGSQMVYGDGGTYTDSTGTVVANFDYMSKGLDVVAHELTHAVTSRTANLIYSNESGGINEATSDIMAAVVESYVDGWAVSTDTWYVGEDIDLLGNGLRLMSNPTADGRSIDDYDDYFNGMDVHFSSGIGNYAFYLWVQDADVTIEEAGDIWYRGLQYYMTPSTDYTGARLATEQAAIDLFGAGSAEHLAVEDGWDDVNVPAGPAYLEFATQTSVSNSTGSSTTFTFTPRSTADAVRFTLEADNGDADLYVKFGSAPNLATGDYDCASTTPDSYELCEDDPSSTGTYYVTVNAWATFSNLTVRAWEHFPCSDLDGDGVTDCDGDCNDTNSNIHPDADEVCNGVDDNCDDAIDGPDSVDATTYYADTDEDGYGDPNNSLAACSQPTGYLTDSSDCDDLLATVNPLATEVCNTLDDDCDGTIDGPKSADISTWYLDNDADGFGTPTESTLECERPKGYVAEDTDCNDNNKDISPAANEICDDFNVDENCNGEAEEAGAEGSRMLLVDEDGDGYGEFGNFVVACDTGPGVVELDGDCDPTDDTVYPGAPESCDDRRDTNCDGFSGDDDADGDGHKACDECDDGSADRYPGATELCDGLDNDCDELVDNDALDAQTWFVDADGDGYGFEAVVGCVQPEGTAQFPGDCDDNDADVYPGALEVAGDGTDNDCDGADLTVDEGELGNGDSLVVCGCNSSTPAWPAGWMILGLGLLAARRRQES